MNNADDYTSKRRAGGREWGQIQKRKPAEPVRQDSRIKPAGSPVGKSHSGVSEHRAAGGELGNLAVHLVDD